MKLSLRPGKNVVTDDSTLAVPLFSNTDCEVDRTARGLWYSFTPTETGDYTAAISNYDFVAGLSMFTGSCSSLQCQDFEDDVLAALGYYRDFDLSWKGSAGTTYYFLVHGSDFDEYGTFELSIEKTER